MEKDTYHFVGDRDETYWWQQARRDMIADLLRRYGVQRHPHWLDLGCGPGGNLLLANHLCSEFIAAVDISPIAIAKASAKAPFANLVSADLRNRLPFASDLFDVVTVLNVLYHEWVSDEIHVLREISRVLRPTGLTVLTEPAFPILRREMDRIAMTRKRYRLSEFKRLCSSAGLHVLFASYFTSFGFPVILAMKALNRLQELRSKHILTAAIDMKELAPRLNSLMYRVARIEGQMIRAGIPIPFGTTLVCVARNGDL